MSYEVGHRHGSHLAVLWLWCRPAAVAPIWSLAWEFLYAMGAALKRPKKKKKSVYVPWKTKQYLGIYLKSELTKKEKKNFICSFHKYLISSYCGSSCENNNNNNKNHTDESPCPQRTYLGWGISWLATIKVCIFYKWNLSKNNAEWNVSGHEEWDQCFLGLVSNTWWASWQWNEGRLVSLGSNEPRRPQGPVQTKADC